MSRAIAISISGCPDIYVDLWSSHMSSHQAQSIMSQVKAASFISSPRGIGSSLQRTMVLQLICMIKEKLVVAKWYHCIQIMNKNTWLAGILRCKFYLISKGTTCMQLGYINSSLVSCWSEWRCRKYFVYELQRSQYYMARQLSIIAQNKWFVVSTINLFHLKLMLTNEDEDSTLSWG